MTVRINLIACRIKRKKPRYGTYAYWIDSLYRGSGAHRLKAIEKVAEFGRGDSVEDLLDSCYGFCATQEAIISIGAPAIEPLAKKFKKHMSSPHSEEDRITCKRIIGIVHAFMSQPEEKLSAAGLSIDSFKIFESSTYRWLSSVPWRVDTLERSTADEAFSILCKLKTKKAKKFFLGALHNHKEFGGELVDALKAVADKSIIKELRDMLTFSNNAQIISNAATILGSIGSKATVKDLLSALDHCSALSSFGENVGKTEESICKALEQILGKKAYSKKLLSALDPSGSSISQGLTLVVFGYSELIDFEPVVSRISTFLADKYRDTVRQLAALALVKITLENIDDDEKMEFIRQKAMESIDDQLHISGLVLTDTDTDAEFAKLLLLLDPEKGISTIMEKNLPQDPDKVAEMLSTLALFAETNRGRKFFLTEKDPAISAKSLLPFLKSDVEKEAKKTAADLLLNILGSSVVSFIHNAAVCENSLSIDEASYAINLLRKKLSKDTGSVGKSQEISRPDEFSRSTQSALRSAPILGCGRPAEIKSAIRT